MVHPGDAACWHPVFREALTFGRGGTVEDRCVCWMVCVRLADLILDIAVSADSSLSSIDDQYLCMRQLISALCDRYNQAGDSPPPGIKTKSAICLASGIFSTCQPLLIPSSLSTILTH